jgi:hypothetical protein
MKGNNALSFPSAEAVPPIKGGARQEETRCCRESKKKKRQPI